MFQKCNSLFSYIRDEQHVCAVFKGDLKVRNCNKLHKGITLVKMPNKMLELANWWQLQG